MANARAQQGLLKLSSLNVVQGNLLEKYVLEGTLGQGNYGKAVLASRIEHPGDKVVIKQILLSDVDERAREVRDTMLSNVFLAMEDRSLFVSWLAGSPTGGENPFSV
jgi:aspartate 1-decarboxylase